MNISEREMGIVHYFLGLTMSLMYLIAGPPLTAHFLDNPGIQFRARVGEGERERERKRKREETQRRRENRAPDLHCLFMTLWHARCVNNLRRNQVNHSCLLNISPSWAPIDSRWENRGIMVIPDRGREIKNR